MSRLSPLFVVILSIGSYMSELNSIFLLVWVQEADFAPGLTYKYFGTWYASINQDDPHTFART